MLLLLLLCMYVVVHVQRGRRIVLVGFVTVESELFDAAFVDGSDLANRSASGAAADHEIVGRAMRQPQRQRPRPERGGDSDLASQMFGG